MVSVFPMSDETFLPQSLAATPAPPSTTPSPFGDRSSVTNGQWSAPGDRSSVSADGSSGELQDPFSVTDLTLALERKRRDHERTRLKRKAVLRRAPRGDDVKTVVKTHRRSASNLSKGQVSLVLSRVYSRKSVP